MSENTIFLKEEYVVRYFYPLESCPSEGYEVIISVPLVGKAKQNKGNNHKMAEKIFKKKYPSAEIIDIN